jgi:hypothetical protein
MCPEEPDMEDIDIVKRWLVSTLKDILYESTTLFSSKYNALDTAIKVSKEFFDRPTNEHSDEEDRPEYSSKLEINMLGLLYHSLEYIKASETTKDAMYIFKCENDITAYLVEEMEIEFEKNEFFAIFKELKSWSSGCFSLIL